MRGDKQSGTNREIRRDVRVIYPITDATIEVIWQAHGLGGVRQTASATSGVSNRCMIVNDALVIRFNVFDTTVPKFENERIAYELLAGRGDRGLPAPRSSRSTRRGASCHTITSS